jgi:hypothetical protein
MDPRRFRDKTKKVAGTTNVDVVSIEYLNPEYEIEVLPPNNLTSPTGLLEVARLNPKKPNLLQFVFRWDENEDTLDVDIYKDGKNCKNLWKKNGYKGHHTQKVDRESKIFKANISIPSQPIFKGKINVDLFIQLTIKDSAKSTDSIKIVHKRVDVKDAGKGKDSIEVDRVNL